MFLNLHHIEVRFPLSICISPKKSFLGMSDVPLPSRYTLTLQACCTISPLLSKPRPGPGIMTHL